MRKEMYVCDPCKAQYDPNIDTIFGLGYSEAKE